VIFATDVRRPGRVMFQTEGRAGASRCKNLQAVKCYWIVKRDTAIRLRIRGSRIPPPFLTERRTEVNTSRLHRLLRLRFFS
jgi:hypothetical protein